MKRVPILIGLDSTTNLGGNLHAHIGDRNHGDVHQRVAGQIGGTAVAHIAGLSGGGTACGGVGGRALVGAHTVIARGHREGRVGGGRAASASAAAAHALVASLSAGDRQHAQHGEEKDSRTHIEWVGEDI